MQSGEPVFYVVLDANIWAAEQLLWSSIGSALLFALTSSRARLALPEVIEMEVNTVPGRQAAEHIESFRKSSRFLRQLSGQSSLPAIPTMQAIEEGLQRRWRELAGVIVRCSPLNLVVIESSATACDREDSA
jgi:hypothetical protein